MRRSTFSSERHFGEGPDRGSILKVALVVGLVLAAVATGPVRAQKMPTLGPIVGHAVGDLPVDFTLKDLDGRPHALKTLRQEKKVVLMVFWASWCVPCMQEVPLVREAYAKYRDRGFEALGIVVNINQTQEGARAFARDFKINYPILWDDDGSIMERYGVQSIPRNFLIGRDGIIRYVGNGLPAAHDALIESLLTGPHVDGAAGAH